MGRSRMFDDEGPSENNSSLHTTKAGGPPESRSDLPPVPSGIQRLLCLAAGDKGFRTSLLAQRGDVAASQGIELSLSERKILEVVPRTQLEAMIDHVVVPKPARRSFLRQTAASAAALLGGAGFFERLKGCDERPSRNQMQTEGGMAPDIPSDPEPDPEPDPDSVPESEPARTPIAPDDRPKVRGIQPDIPPEKPQTK